MGFGCDTNVIPVIGVIDTPKIGKEKESYSFDHGKKDLSRDMFQKGHHANQCPEKKKGKAK
jgi:hypothetical protein